MYLQTYTHYVSQFQLIMFSSSVQRTWIANTRYLVQMLFYNLF